MHILKFVSLISIFPLLFPSTSKAEDLLCVYELAIVNDSQIKTARATQLAAQEAMPQACALFLPVIGANSLNTYYNKVYQPGFLQISNISIPITTTKFHYMQNVYGLSLNQPVFYYQQWVQLAKAHAEVKQANATFAAAEQDLILRTIQAYFNVLKASDALKYAKALRLAYYDTQLQTEQQFKAGAISTRVDVEITKARYASALSQEISAQNNLTVQKRLLSEIICLKIENFAFLRNDITLSSPDPNNMEAWVCQALEQNLNLLAARFQTEISRTDIKIKGSGHLPTVNINGAVVRSTATQDLFPLPNNINSYIGVQLNVPLFSGGSVISKTKQARYEFLKDLNQLETLYRQVESSTQEAYLGVMTQISLISANKAAFTANKIALASTEGSYKAGVKTIVDVLNAQSDLIQSEQNYANARYDYILKRAQLKQAAGILYPDEIFQINCWLQATSRNPD